LKEKTKEAASLAKEVEDIRQENTGLKNQLRQTKELEDEIKRLSQAKSDLSQQLDVLTSKFLSAKDDAAQAKRALSDLAEQSKGAEQTQNTIEILKAENARLRKQTDDLDGQTAVSTVEAPGDFQALNEKIRELKHDQEKWIGVANVSSNLSVVSESTNQFTGIVQTVQSSASGCERGRETLAGCSKQGRGDRQFERATYCFEGRPVQWREF
jgi:chromosome segregation ATPase